MDILRVFTGSDGRSHLEDFTVALEDHGAWGEISNVWPANGVQFRTVPRNYFLDFHTAPRRQLVVTLSGSVEPQDPRSRNDRPRRGHGWARARQSQR
jgi:hypothetical protein